MAGKKEYELAIKIAGMVDKSLDSSCNLTKKQLRSIAREAANASSGGMSLRDSWTEAGKGIDVAWNGAKKTVVAASQAMLVAGAAVTAIGVASINTGKEFEAAMSSWSATATATEEDYRIARDAAMEMGRTTSKTATESAQALEYMALAGWSVGDSVSGLPGILRLSEATGLDLARTSDLVTDSMSALGVEVDELGIYLDVAAKANNKSNQTAEHLMEAYIGVGGTMKSLRVPIQESATALGVMANRGIKGSEAGNALNAVMVNLTTGVGQAGKKMKELGISAFDSEGKFIGLRETLNVLDKSVSKLNEEDRNKALSAIGGKLHIDALNALLSGLNTTVEDGVTEWGNLEAQLYDSAGALEQMANVKLDNLEGDFAIMQSALQDSGIRIYDSLQEPLREATQGATELIYSFTDNIVGGLEGGIPTIKRHMKEAAEAVMDFADPFLMIGGWMIDNPDIVAGTLAAIGTTIVSLKLAQTITSTASAINALKIAMMSNPITAAIGIAALAGGAIVGLAAQAKVANENLKKEKLSECFGDITLSLDDLEKMAIRIIDNGNFGKLSLAMNEFDKVEGLAKNLTSSTEGLDKLNWKISLGLELSEEESSEYGRQIESFVENAVALGEQQQYAMNLNLKLLTKDDETGREIIGQFNSFYNDLNAELRMQGEELGAKYAEGTLDGVLSIPEVEAIQEIQKKMADITAKLSSSRFEAKMETISMKYENVELDADTFQNMQIEMQEQVDLMVSDLEESLTMNIQGAKILLDAGEIDQSQYQIMISEFRKNHLDQVAEVQAQASNYQAQAISKAFSEDIGAIIPEMGENLSTAFGEVFDYIGESNNTYGAWDYDQVVKWLDIEGLDNVTKAALADLWVGMEPQFQDLLAIKKQYEDYGRQVPESVAKGISDAAAIGVLAGSEAALWEAMAGKAEENPEYQNVLEAMHANGYAMPDRIAEGIKSNQASANKGVDSLYNSTKMYLDRRFADPFSVHAKVNVNYATSTPSVKVFGSEIYPHAEGGIFDTPHFGVFAESGPEAFIPLDGSKNAVSIWQEAGEQLGVMKKNESGSDDSGSIIDSGSVQNNSESQIIFSPVYNIAPGSEAAVRDATEDAYQKFEQLMKRYQRTQQRLAF